MKRKPYDTDVTNVEWAILKPLIPEIQPGGHPRFRNMREIINAIFYIQRAGCAWRLLPYEFPPWQTEYVITFALGGLQVYGKQCSSSRTSASSVGTSINAKRWNH